MMPERFGFTKAKSSHLLHHEMHLLFCQHIVVKQEEGGGGDHLFPAHLSFMDAPAPAPSHAVAAAAVVAVAAAAVVVAVASESLLSARTHSETGGVPAADCCHTASADWRLFLESHIDPAKGN